MKKSIKYLPPEKQDDLNYLVQMIRERIPQTEMIILYGSYATGKYVDYDTRVEFGIRTTYRSDYDILVVTHGIKDKEAGLILNCIEDIYYKKPDKQTPLQFINDDIDKLNKNLSDGRYFYTQIKEEGVILYDSENYKLARKRKLKYDEIKQQAEEYFNEKFKKANLFLSDAIHNKDKEEYIQASFYLHQVCENLFYATRLTFTLENSKQHNLAKLLAYVKRYSPEFDKIFPLQTPEEKRLFNLLKLAYVEARYNPDFIVTKEDIETLIPIVERFSGLVKDICEKRIVEYGEMAKK